MDELIKRLWECASGECFNCSQYTVTTNASVCSKELMKQAADAIEELNRDLDSMNEANIALYGALPRWIPVTERFPEFGVRVLCKCRANIYEVLTWTADGWEHDPQHVYMSGFVTHWQPLPQPPKEE